MTKASHQGTVVGNKGAARELYREALRMCDKPETAESGLQCAGR